MISNVFQHNSNKNKTKFRSEKIGSFFNSHQLKVIVQIQSYGLKLSDAFLIISCPALKS